MPVTEQRPVFGSIKTGAEFERWYWLKEELLEYCRTHKISTSGGKQELTERIVQFLDTGTVVEIQQRRANSRFDWSSEELTVSTEITDNYRNTQNMRSFMKAKTCDRFSFSNEFMQWMRDNTGKTLGDALDFWIELDLKKKNNGYREKPLPQNQYNQFTRALSTVKPGISNKEIRRLWAIKRSKPGPHIYKPGDESF